MSQERTCMGRLLRAEKMKYRRSGTDMLWYLLPVLTLAVAFVLSTTYGTVSAYNWWYVGMYPASLAPGLGISLALLVLLWCLSRRWYERKGAARV